MITGARSKPLESAACQSTCPRLSALERGLLKWAVIDREDRVLDVGLGNGLMADYLRRNMECDVCGVSDNMELVRRTRSLVRSADLIYANDGDIPWRNHAFDVVLLRPKAGVKDALSKQLMEIKRVLKDGGQLVLGVECCPSFLKPVVGMLTGQEETGEGEAMTRQDLSTLLTEAGFEHLTWQRASLLAGVMICWKHNAVMESFQQA